MPQNEDVDLEEKVKKRYELGLLYRNGKDVKQDYVKASKLFCDAVEQGHAES